MIRSNKGWAYILNAADHKLLVIRHACMVGCSSMLVMCATHLTYSTLPLVTQGVRRLGAASVDLCHVAMGIVDS
jgi:fructose-1,6-bisphosphatase/inositol monophosphatase family enzyme